MENETRKRKNRPNKRQREARKRRKESVVSPVDKFYYLKQGVDGIATANGFIRAGTNGRIPVSELTQSGADVQWLIGIGMIGENNQPFRTHGQ